MLYRSILAALIGLFSLTASIASAQFAGGTLPADEAFILSVDTAGPDIAFEWEIAPGYYLYRDKLKASTADGSEMVLEVPYGVVVSDENFGDVEVFYNDLIASTQKTASPITLIWQGCKEDSICYPPQSRLIDVSGLTPKISQSPYHMPGMSAASVNFSFNEEPGLTLDNDPGLLGDLAARGGSLLVILGFFTFGVLLSFTPCVFPMFPIVAGMVMGQKDKLSMRRGLSLAGAYVFAMAAAFALFGVFAAWSGKNLQIALQSPVVIGISAAVFLLLALSMFGAFSLQLPQALSSRLQSIQGRRGSFGGAALLGFTSALIMGPCVTAPLAGALLYIGNTGDVTLGALALFALGFGQGVPLLAIGAFGPRILPKTGAWMVYAKYAFGLIFLGIAIWLGSRILPGPATLALWAILLIGVGALLAGLAQTSVHGRLARAFGVILAFAGGIQGVGSAIGGDDPLRPLALLVAQAPGSASVEAFETVKTTAALNEALSRDGRPALAYVTAQWCTTCRSIERGPLADINTMAALQDLNLIKVDVTEFGDEGQALLDTLAAAGPPTMVFFDRQQREVPGSRIVGDVEHEDILKSTRIALK